ncbi:MAG: hypothetical protein PHS95_02240 [Candidatus Pacebacteria bacterium]|nr:hypothetical protein [Candidatus Paceibacterota bacterium]
MKITKKQKNVIVAVLVVVVILAVGFFYVSHKERNYSLADLGIPELLKSDCSSVKDTTANSPVSISFNAPNVSKMRDEVKALATKYEGRVISDSFNSYPGSTPDSYSQDSASITVVFDKPASEFLTELSAKVKSSGGMDTSYNYTDGSQPQYGGYSSYSSCINMMQIVSADTLQLQIFTKALKEERSPAKILLLSQSISTINNTLQSDINNVNNFFQTSEKPSVSISIYSFQK